MSARGGVSAPGGCLHQGMSAPGGVCSGGGVSAPWGGGLSAPEGCMLLERGVCSRGRMSAPRGVCSQGGVCSRGVSGGDPPGTATAAGGMHPTGMHSCLASSGKLWLPETHRISH